MTNNNNEIHPAASFGDLVRVVGYGDRVFMVEEFIVEYQHRPDGSITPNVAYDLTCPFTFEFIIGEQADIAVVCKAATAHTFISKMTPYSPPDAPVDYPPSLFSQIKKHNLEVITPADVSKHEKPKRKTQRQKQTEIDGLLDELNVLKTVIEICGTDEDYAGRIADVKRKLKEASV